MKILVTGGAGFVGTNLIKRLLKDGHQVQSLDNYSTGLKSNEVEGCRYWAGDIQNISTMDKDFDVVFHLAAIARIQPSFDRPEEYINTNFNGTYEVVKGTRFKEEMAEINLAGGIEWWYNNTFAIRGGVFYENKNKGNRQFMNIGASLKYNMFGIDFSYLASLNGRQSPLANTLRFTLRLYLGDKPASKDAN